MEILFKAKDIKTDEWVSGFYANCDYPDKPNSHETGHFIIEYPNKYHEIYTSTCCRYTGLTYQDGTKAWEGDIINCRPSPGRRGAIGIIRYDEFNNKYIGFYIEWIGIHHDMRNDPLYWIDKVECIGNVVDNSELLGGEIVTEQEKKEIIDELEKRIDEKYKGILSHEDVSSILSEPRNKWFRDPDVKSASVAKKSLMVEALGNSVIAWQVWEEIRKLTCRICRKAYVRQLTDSDNTDDVAEMLCQTVYDLAMDRRKVTE